MEQDENNTEYFLEVLTDLKEEVEAWSSIVVTEVKPLYTFYTAVCDYFLIGKEFAHFPACLTIDWEEQELIDVFWFIFGKGRRYLMKCATIEERMNGGHPNRGKDFELMKEVAETVKHRLIE